MDDLDGALLVEVEVGGLGVLVHKGRGRGVGGGQRVLCEHGGRAVVHVAGGGAGVEGRGTGNGIISMDGEREERAVAG